MMGIIQAVTIGMLVMAAGTLPFRFSMQPLNIALLSVTGLLILIIPVACILFWFVDLFAKSYDTPEHQLGILVLTFLAATLSVGYGFVLRLFVVSLTQSKWNLVVAPFVLLALVSLMYMLWDVDWLPVYASGFLLPLFLILFRGGLNSRIITIISVATCVLLLSLVAYSLSPQARFARYSNMLSACWCCDYKTRAVHELCAFGPNGYRTIAQHVEHDPTERRQIIDRFRHSKDPAIKALTDYLSEIR